MATKKTANKEKVIKEPTKHEGKYFYAVGRRKTSVAKIKLFISKEKEETSNVILVNEKTVEDYFPIERLIETIKEPLIMAGDANKFKTVVKVSGGGVNSQAEAIRLGIARALVIFDETLKKTLKDKGFLTRDSREVERKKPGLKKARKSPQWAKR